MRSLDLKVVMHAFDQRTPTHWAERVVTGLGPSCHRLV